MRRFWTLSVVGSLLLLAACSNATVVETSFNERDPIGQELPLSSLLYRTPEIENAIQMEFTRVVGECMRERGFDYPAPEPLLMPAELFFQRPFGVSTLGEATSRGFRGPLLPDGIDRIDRFAAGLPDSEHDAWFAALTGMLPPEPSGVLVPPTQVGEVGCETYALEQQIGDPQTYGEIRTRVEALANEALNRSADDSRLHDALSVWSQCMTVKGFDVATPIDAIQLGLSGLRTDEPTEFEITVAVADVECQDQAHLMEVWLVVQSEIERQLFSENKSDVVQLQEIRKRERNFAGTE